MRDKTPAAHHAILIRWLRILGPHPGRDRRAATIGVSVKDDSSRMTVLLVLGLNPSP
jgi:hypothetical protein